MDTNQPPSVIGSFRRFGPYGPAYEVVKLLRQDGDGSRWMQVHIFDSNEDVEYKLEDLLNDPMADVPD